MSESLISVLTALGDDELILGHRHSEWTGFAPHIEEDVAFSSIAQDEIGHASNYYSIVAQLSGESPDHIAFGRDKTEYRNAILCERDNRDWAYTLARHWLYDHADEIRLESLEGSKHPEVAALVSKIRREERYHLIHADSWIRRVVQGPAEGRTRFVDAITDAYADALALFEPFEHEEEALREGYLPVSSAELQDRFVDQMGAALDDLGLPTSIRSRADDRAEFVASSSGDLIESDAGGGSDGDHEDASGGRKGRRSPEFDALWEDMTAMYRAEPGATW